MGEWENIYLDLFQMVVFQDIIKDNMVDKFKD